MAQTPQPLSAATAGMSASAVSAVMSLIASAPAARASRATAARKVSTDSGSLVCSASATITGSTRRSSSSRATGVAPGRVLWPPMSRRSAPSAASRRPCSTAWAGSKYRPPSEKLSGVTLTTPIRSGIGPAVRDRVRSFQASHLCTFLPSYLLTSLPSNLPEAYASGSRLCFLPSYLQISRRLTPPARLPLRFP